MKNLFKTTLVITSVFLTACSAAPTDMQEMMDDHHEGETNVMPHDDNAMPMMDDHHEGEEDVEPHGHEDDSAPKPPSRSKKTDDDHHEGEENVDPHGH